MKSELQIKVGNSGMSSLILDCSDSQSIYLNHNRSLHYTPVSSIIMMIPNIFLSHYFYKLKTILKYIFGNTFSI